MYSVSALVSGSVLFRGAVGGRNTRPLNLTVTMGEFTYTAYVFAIYVYTYSIGMHIFYASESVDDFF